MFKFSDNLRHEPNLRVALEILDYLCFKEDIPKGDVVGQYRDSLSIHVRDCFIYICLELGIHYTQIGKILNRDRSSILYHRKQKILYGDPRRIELYKRTYETVKQQIYGR